VPVRALSFVPLLYERHSATSLQKLKHGPHETPEHDPPPLQAAMPRLHPPLRRGTAVSLLLLLSSLVLALGLVAVEQGQRQEQVELDEKGVRRGKK
jgi:uncharacterized protein HemX